jgi:hypothetical protein
MAIENDRFPTKAREKRIAPFCAIMGTWLPPDIGISSVKDILFAKPMEIEADRKARLRSLLKMDALCKDLQKRCDSESRDNIAANLERK